MSMLTLLFILFAGLAIGFGALALILLLAIAIVIARSSRRGADLAMAHAIRADELEERYRAYR